MKKIKFTTVHFVDGKATDWSDVKGIENCDIEELDKITSGQSTDYNNDDVGDNIVKYLNSLNNDYVYGMTSIGIPCIGQGQYTLAYYKKGDYPDKGGIRLCIDHDKWNDYIPRVTKSIAKTLDNIDTDSLNKYAKKIEKYLNSLNNGYFYDVEPDEAYLQEDPCVYLKISWCKEHKKNHDKEDKDDDFER